MEISERESDGICVMQPEGRIDSMSCRVFENRMLTAMGTGDGQMLIDFTTVDFISSAGLRVLLMVLKRMRASGGQLALSGMDSATKQVFDISGFSSLFDIYPDIDSALNVLRR